MYLLIMANIAFCTIFSNFLANFAKCWHVIANTNSLVCCKIAFVLLRDLDLVQQSFEPKFLLLKAISREKKILIEKKIHFLSFQALLFRLPWKLWRHLEGGKIEEFGLEAKRHLLTHEESEILARQYAESFEV